MAEYNALIAQGSLKEDAFQRTIIETLQHLHDRLTTYTPQPIGEKQPEKESGFFSKVLPSGQKQMFARKMDETNIDLPFFLS